jgi:EmrB/QacA subfamily drug resistance transporter
LTTETQEPAVAPAPVAAQPAPPTQSLRLLLTALMLVMLLAALDGTIVSTALPTIVGELGGLDQLSWVVTAYLLSSTVVVPLYGKFGDLYGRKLTMQVALAIFLVGSVLCGLAQNMVELILMRALQGLGGGGLVVVTIASIGDVIPPAERGRYQGLFGGVYGLATVLGPLMGGFMVDHLSWRWIFYANLPLGLACVAIIAAVFRPHARPVRHAIDYWGAGLLTVALSCIILFTTEGGSALPWDSVKLWLILALGMAGIVGFVFAERAAAEPIMPLHLFGHRIFLLSSLIGFFVGAALFGSTTFIPLYMQVVKGASPTVAGMQLLPLMGGVILSSVVVGRLISRLGRYRVFPILGTAISAIGLALLGTLRDGDPVFLIHVYTGLLGAGLGMVMQVLVLATQNSVEMRHLGVATSGVTLFRSIGGSIGVSLFGAIFSIGLQSRLRGVLPEGAHTGTSFGPEAVKALPPAVHEKYVHAFGASMHTVYFVAAGLVVVAFLMALRLHDVPLRKTPGHGK